MKTKHSEQLFIVKLITKSGDAVFYVEPSMGVTAFRACAVRYTVEQLKGFHLKDYRITLIPVKG